MTILKVKLLLVLVLVTNCYNVAGVLSSLLVSLLQVVVKKVSNILQLITAFLLSLFTNYTMDSFLMGVQFGTGRKTETWFSNKARQSC